MKMGVLKIIMSKNVNYTDGVMHSKYAILYKKINMIKKVEEFVLPKFRLTRLKKDVIEIQIINLIKMTMNSSV